MKVVILCGGMGIRFKGFIDDVPKPLIRIGDIPVLLHVMDHYAHFGHLDFILCLGYRKGDFIKYFSENMGWIDSGVDKDSTTISFVRNDRLWTVNLLDTGVDTNTGGRIKSALEYITEENFFLTYADGITNLNLNELNAFHIAHRGMATITAAKIKYQYGVVEFDSENRVIDFKEKPFLDIWANIGFFVLQTENLRPLIEFQDAFEIETIKKIRENGNLFAFQFNGFWKGMDTYKDYLELNEEWKGGDAPWIKNGFAK